MSKRKRQTGRNPTGTFLGLPHVVMESEDFRTLSGSALKVLLMIAYQYNGRNNGDLSATATQARRWGIASDQTLSKAIKELLEKDLILKTRQSYFMNPGARCNLYALTWQRIDKCDGKLDIHATPTAPRKFSMNQSRSPLQKM